MKCDKKTMLLYAVTDRAWVGRQSLYEQVEAAIRGGATCVQIREKELDDGSFLQEATEIKELCHRYGVPLFINDNVEVAVKCGADGVHVGQDDMDAASVRQRVGDGMMNAAPTASASGRCSRRPQRRTQAFFHARPFGISAPPSTSRSSPSAVSIRAI